MDPDKIEIPVPMRDARRIYAALGSLKRIAANEGNDEFVETLDGLMDRLKDCHNSVVAEWGAGRNDLIKGSEEDRRGPTGREPRRDASPQDRDELLSRLYGAQTEEQIDDAVAAADRWLVERTHDEDVRQARDQAIRRRAARGRKRVSLVNVGDAGRATPWSRA